MRFLESPELRRRVKSGRLGVVVAEHSGHVVFATDQAQYWLEKYFSYRRRSRELPALIQNCLGLKDKPWPLIAENKQRRLFVTALDEESSDRACFLLREVEASASLDKVRKRLTPREGEVLHWVARGKSNSQIAMILALRIATVRKHLQRIFPKLGVENRTAAASFGQ